MSLLTVPLAEPLIPLKELISALTYPSIQAQSKQVITAIRKHLKYPKNKSLYSARHSFITNLINANVPPHIVAELAGHSNKGMTLSNYWNGSDISTLKKYIDLL